MSRLQFAPSMTVQIYITKDLYKCDYVFIRNDCKKPLTVCNNGPYFVIDRTYKFFTVLRNGKKETVAVNRLNPANVDASNSTSSASQQNTTRKGATSSTSQQSQAPSEQQPQSCTQRITKSGRKVTWPKHFKSYIPLN